MCTFELMTQYGYDASHRNRESFTWLRLMHKKGARSKNIKVRGAEFRQSGRLRCEMHQLKILIETHNISILGDLFTI